MAKTKGSEPPNNEFSYRDADGTDRYMGEFLRSIFRAGSISRYNPEEDITGFSQRLLRPGQQGPGSVDQEPIRDNFLACIALWNSLPADCPDPLPELPVTSKESVWDAKVEHGVVCSYYDLFLRCCLKWALDHNGDMPDGDCFPCISLCTCEGVAIGYTTQGMAINEEQTLTVVGATDGCTYEWEIVSGGGSLSSNEGLSVQYTAPSTNPFCNLNPVIRLSLEGEECDSLDIAVNAVTWWSGAAYHKKYCEIESSCEQFVHWHCASALVGSYQCTDVFRGNVGSCPTAGCNGPGCCCVEHDDCTLYIYDYCQGQSGAMTCAESAELAGCTHPGSLGEGFDDRPEFILEYGCCPEGIL